MIIILILGLYHLAIFYFIYLIIRNNNQSKIKEKEMQKEILNKIIETKLLGGK